MSDEQEKITESETLAKAAEPSVAGASGALNADGLLVVGAAPGASSVMENKRFKRKGIVAMTAETLGYIESAEKDKTIYVRNDDKTSTVFLFLALITSAVFAFVLVLTPGNRPLCIALALISDFLFGMAILWFVLLRFGVLRTIEPKFALLCWQLMLGAGVLFAFYTMNVAFFFFTLYTQIAPAGSAPLVN